MARTLGLLHLRGIAPPQTGQRATPRERDGKRGAERTRADNSNGARGSGRMGSIHRVFGGAMLLVGRIAYELEV